VSPNQEQQHLQRVQCDFGVVFQGRSDMLKLFAEEGALLLNFEVAKEGWVDFPQELLLGVKSIIFRYEMGIGAYFLCIIEPYLMLIGQFSTDVGNLLQGLRQIMAEIVKSNERITDGWHGCYTHGNISTKQISAKL
jgi:hypothetical protein